MSETYEELRDQHWDFFDATVRPLIERQLRDSLPHRLAQAACARLHVRHRFRPSEPIFYLYLDRLSEQDETAAPACAAVETLQLARLTADDALDRHRWRNEKPTIAEEFGRKRAFMAARAMAGVAASFGVDFDRIITSRGQQAGAAECLLRYERRMVSGMLEELEFAAATFPLESYEELCKKKHCNGACCAELIILAAGLTTEDSGAIKAAMERSDLAGAVANDYSETTGLRGLEPGVAAAGSRRGDRTEFQLGRPTIFHAYLRSRDRLGHQIRSSPYARFDQGINFLELSPADLQSHLLAIGALDYAKTKRDNYRAEALSLLPPGHPRTESWMKLTAKIHGRD